MRRLKPSPWAVSELDIQLETLDIEKDPDILAVLTRYSGGVLTVEEGADLWSIRAGLIFLANGCDEWAARSESCVSVVHICVHIRATSADRPSLAQRLNRRWSGAGDSPEMRRYERRYEIKKQTPLPRHGAPQGRQQARRPYRLISGA